MSKRKNSIISVIAVFLGMVLCIVAGFMIQNSSLAWFASNKSVEANGMEVSAKVTPNLVISDKIDLIASPDILKSGSPFAVDLKKSKSQMAPATHDDEAQSGSFLKYVSNAGGIDMNTGYNKPGQELNFTEVLVAEDSIFYFDCIVYIASAGTTLDVETLTATFFTNDQITLEENAAFFAASIDFYLGEVSADSYKGTLSLAEAREGGRVDIYEGQIPLNTEGHLTVIMRFYFDGDLANPEKQGYACINSDTVEIDKNINLSVSFEAE